MAPGVGGDAPHLSVSATPEDTVGVQPVVGYSGRGCARALLVGEWLGGEGTVGRLWVRDGEWL